jgi:hypothetical protein
MGLRFGALIGHGAGYGVYDKLKEALGTDVNYFFNVDRSRSGSPTNLSLGKAAIRPGQACKARRTAKSLAVLEELPALGSFCQNRGSGCKSIIIQS